MDPHPGVTPRRGTILLGWRPGCAPERACMDLDARRTAGGFGLGPAPAPFRHGNMRRAYTVESAADQASLLSARPPAGASIPVSSRAGRASPVRMDSPRCFFGLLRVPSPPAGSGALRYN